MTLLPKPTMVIDRLTGKEREADFDDYLAACRAEKRELTMDEFAALAKREKRGG